MPSFQTHVGDLLLSRFAEVKFTQEQVQRVERLLTLFKVDTGTPYNVLEHTSFVDFIQALRPDFRIPSRRTMGRRLHEVYTDVQAKVAAKVNHIPWMALAVDGWEDHQKREVLAMVGMPLGQRGKPLLLSFARQETQPGLDV